MLHILLESQFVSYDGVCSPHIFLCLTAFINFDHIICYSFVGASLLGALERKCLPDGYINLLPQCRPL